MELLSVLQYLALLLLLAAPLLAPLVLLAGAVVMVSGARAARSTPAWSASVAPAALVAAYWTYGSGLGQGGFGLLETAEACGVGEDRVVDVEESYVPPSFRCSLDDGTVLELVSPATTPLTAAFLAVAVLAVAARAVSRRRPRDAGSLGSPL